MVGADDGGRGRRRWAMLPLAVILLCAAILGGAPAAVVVAGMALQVVVAARPSSTMSRSVGGWIGRVGGGTRTLIVRVVPAIVGTMALLVALDWGVGTLIDRGGGAAEVDAGVRDLAAVSLPHSSDPRVRSEAMAGAPWADRYFAELEAVRGEYVPFIGYREAPTHGRHINVAHGVRESYEPAGADGDRAREVWFFGGSTMWGEGQRDRYTIASDVARMAERDGVTLRVLNFGVRGYSAYQEFLVFEQEVARRGPPDLAVFYHGINELLTQVESPENLSRQPTIFQLRVYRDAFRLAPALPGMQAPHEPSVSLDYTQTSAVNKLLRSVRSLAAVPPAAADEPFYQPPPEVLAAAVDNAEEIYRRSIDLIHHSAREYGVRPLIFWQPAVPREQDPTYYELGDRVAGEGIDISDALSNPPSPIFIDGAHTNELGARMSARAIWAHLAPAIDALPRR